MGVIVCRNIWTKIPNYQLETQPKVFENKSLSGTERSCGTFSSCHTSSYWPSLCLANQPDIVNSDKEQKTIVMIDVAILVDTNIRKKQKTEVTRAEGATGTNVESRVQSGSSDDSLQQIPGTSSEVSVQKTPSLRTARILCRTLKLSEDSEFEYPA